jgi:hypothetical protein
MSMWCLAYFAWRGAHMTRETHLERARRDVAEVDGRIGKQELLIVRLRHRGVDAMRAAHVLDGMKGARRLAAERLAREEVVRRVSLWLQVAPSSAMH